MKKVIDLHCRNDSYFLYDSNHEVAICRKSLECFTNLWKRENLRLTVTTYPFKDSKKVIFQYNKDFKCHCAKTLRGRHCPLKELREWLELEKGKDKKLYYKFELIDGEDS